MNDECKEKSILVENMKRINKKLIMYKIDFLKPKQKIIKELLLQSIYISIYYPTINVDPENFGKAYQVVYNQYYSLLSHSLLKVDKIKVQHTVIEDDKNILFNHYTNDSIWTTSSIESDYYTFDEKEQSIYTVNFYMDKDYTIYKRRYVKLQETLTVVSTFVKLNYIVFKFLLCFIIGLLCIRN